MAHGWFFTFTTLQQEQAITSINSSTTKRKHEIKEHEIKES